MKNELQRHKKSDKIKWIAVFAAVILLAVSVTAAITKGFKDFNPYGWFDKKDESIMAPNDKNGGAIINTPVENGVKLSSTKIAATDYAANGVSASAETAYTLTATIKPDNATNRLVDWSVVWVDSSASFVAGKTVTDYVTVKPTSDGSLTARVECLQAFGAQIKVVVTSRDNTKFTAECVFDYAERIETVVFKANTLSIPSSGMDDDLLYFDNNTTNLSMRLYPLLTDTVTREIKATVVSSVYTLKGSFTELYSLKITPELETRLSEIPLNANFARTVPLSGGFSPNRAFFDTLFGADVYSDSVKLGKLLHALNDFETNYTLECDLVGYYSQKHFSIPLKINTSEIKIGVSSVTVNNSGLVF